MITVNTHNARETEALGAKIAKKSDYFRAAQLFEIGRVFIADQHLQFQKLPKSCAARK